MEFTSFGDSNFISEEAKGGTLKNVELQLLYLKSTTVLLEQIARTAHLKTSYLYSC